jgi:hypothetical protein
LTSEEFSNNHPHCRVEKAQPRAALAAHGLDGIAPKTARGKKNSSHKRPDNWPSYLQHICSTNELLSASPSPASGPV